VTTQQRAEREPETVAGAVRAIVNAQRALEEDPNRATEVGRKLFPSTEAELIAELIRRDLPYYDPTISEAFVVGMNQFARDIGILEGHVPYSQVVATQFCPLWQQ
jgi:ABC-type nitrate/sulfonate/bicarbonate transport system substrate-binding protein